MATRFGGQFSPDGTTRGPDSPRPDRAGGAPGGRDDLPVAHRLASRPKWVVLASTPLVLAAFFQPPLWMVTNLAGFGVIALAMRLTRDGLAAEAAYDARRTARRPTLPRKLIGGLLAGLGLGLGAAEPGAAGGALVIGLAAVVLHWLAFGPDPLRDKGLAGVDGFHQDRAARMIDEGEAHLAQMQQAIRLTGDRRLEARVAGFAAAVRDLFDRVRDNPGDLSGTRRYLGVYLVGARDATAKFASLYARTGDPETRRAYEAFLDDLEADFDARAQRLLEGDRDDLDIEISVLRERLAREGLRPAPDRALPLGEEAQTLDALLRPDRDSAGGSR